jgi:3-isopropylmalate/(R)-2-methylmalate dehydratase large subunit
VGALALDLAEADLVKAVAAGKLSLTVPPTVQVRIEERLPRHAGAWDVAARVGELLGHDLEGRVVELVGEVKDWGVDFRIALTGLLHERGAFAALVEADAAVSRFYKDHGLEVAVEELRGEDGYEKKITLDARSVPAVSAPDYAAPGKPVSAGNGEAVQGIFIGSCYGGRYADLALAAEVLKRSGRVRPGVRLVISPATLETARASLAAGFYETFLQVGAMVVAPGGGPGTAAGAIFGDGELIASTAEYHRHLQPGQGLPTVHIVGPATAAVAAATGGLGDPSGFLA